MKRNKLYFLHTSDSHALQPGELEAVKTLYGVENVGTLLTKIKPGQTVIPRFRSIPFGLELEKEVIFKGATLINSYREHRQVADIGFWADELATQGLTVPAYNTNNLRLDKLPEQAWFVKGETNSLKNRWFECCYAETTSDLPRIIANNQADTYIGHQNIYVRPYVEFRKIGDAVDGRPVFNERRCFVYKNQVLSTADYWSSFPEYATPALDEEKFKTMLDRTVKATIQYATFRVLDFAELPNGEWLMVEINDGCMSGLSDNQPADVWGGLLKAFSK